MYKCPLGGGISMLKLMSKFSISTRIFFGFFALVSIISGITASFWWVGHRADTIVQSLAGTASVALGVATINGELQAMHRLSDTLFYTGKTTYADEVRSRAVRTHDHLQNLIQTTPNPTKKQQISQILHQIDSYIESFERRVKFTEEKASLLTRFINPVALKLIENLNNLYSDAEQESNTRAVQYLTKVSNLFIRAHLAKADFLIQKDLDPHTTVLPLFDKAVQNFSAVRPILEKMGKSSQYHDITSLFNTYRSSFARIAELVFYDQSVIQPEIEERRNVLGKLTEATLSSDVKNFATQSRTIHAEISHSRNAVVIVAAVMAVLALIWSTLITYGISNPLHKIVETIQNLPHRDRHVAIPYRDHEDEVGKVAHAVAMLKETLEQNAVLEAQHRQDMEKKAARGAHLKKLMDAFDHDVRMLLGAVSYAADDLNSTAESMASIARKTGLQAVAVTQSSEGISMNAHCAVTASEHLDDMFCKISDDVCHAAAFSHSTLQKARDSIGVVADLKLAATEIDTVTHTMAEISRQTSLLSVNAALESDRSEDINSRSFQEIIHALKKLSTQTTQATEDVRPRVGEIQSSLEKAADALLAIAALVEEVAGVALTITQSIEEQSTVVHDISHNLMKMARSTTSMTTTIDGVSQSAATADTESGRVLVATHALHHDAEELRNLVETFLAQVRAA